MSGPVPLWGSSQHGEHRPDAHRPGTLLLIGYPEDRCCELVTRAAGSLGYDVVLTSDPLAAPFCVRWSFDSSAENDDTAWGEVGRTARHVAGVLVRASGGPASAEGWDQKDLTYARTEAQAALIAWLWSLPCPVINRLRTDVWFRPRRSYPEWHALFTRCGLPTAAICITSDVEAARVFAARDGGVATYAPLTSSSRYPITEPRHWEDLARVAAHVPVCLMESGPGHSTYASVVGGHIVWNEDATSEVKALAPGLRRLADQQGLDLFQVEIIRGPRGPLCVSADPYPLLERHDDAAESTLVARLVDLLCSGRRAPVRPPEVSRLGGRSAG
jgi:hypothetical protein